MSRNALAAVKPLIGALLMAMAIETITAQNVPGQSAPPEQNPKTGVAQSGPGQVGVDPKQPHRPIPLKRMQARDSIFSFYLRVLNPRQVEWGDYLDARMSAFAEQSVQNPCFRLCALQAAVNIILMVTCWLWWDKLRQVKWVAAECLADTINALADMERRAEGAISEHNQHKESCNRVIEGMSGSAVASSDEIRKLETDLATSKREEAILSGKLRERDTAVAMLGERIRLLEEEIQRRGQESPNAELAARLARAESQLAGKVRRNAP